MIKSFLIIFLLIPSLVCAGQGMGPGPGVKAYAAGSSFPANGILEAFTGTNGTTPPNANWTNLYNGLAIQSNQGTGNTAADTNVSKWNAAVTADHSEMYITVVTLPNEEASKKHLDLYYSKTANGHGYVVSWEHISGTDTIKLFKETSGSFEGQLGSTINQEIAAGDSIGLYKNGNIMQIWYKASGGSWAQLGSDFTNSDYTGCNELDVEVYGTVIRVDNFGGGSR